MEAIKNISDVRAEVQSLKDEGRSVALVPTMGAFHEGHRSLIRLAQEQADEVVVSIYVNPEQFAPDEDFDEYPRQLQGDLDQCRELGVAAVFAPTDEVIYPGNQFLSIEVEELNNHIDGGSRPGFFEGILLIVNKLFNIVEPDLAVFGQKDIQQFRILQQMVQEFNHDTSLLMGPIQRASDGLALSSRNAYLGKEQRKLAPSLYRSLQFVEKQLTNGVKRISLLLEHQRSELEEKGIEVDYFNLFSFDQLAPVERTESSEKYILAGAIYIGDTRLIDNCIITT